MIPKNLFFIWFGDTKPNYIDFAINSFKNINPDFKVSFLRYTVSQIENKESVSEYDHNVYNCVDYILQKEPVKYKNAIKYYIKDLKRSFIQTLANIVRLDLLHEYGGIYLDCDSYPMKPFDENLLSKHSLYSYMPGRKNSKVREKNCNFLASITGFYMDQYYLAYEPSLVNPYDCFNDPNWNNRRKLFFNCSLDYVQMNCEHYIEHYYDGTWIFTGNKKLRTPTCKYDKDTI